MAAPNVNGRLQVSAIVRSPAKTENWPLSSCQLTNCTCQQPNSLFFGGGGPGDYPVGLPKCVVQISDLSIRGITVSADNHSILGVYTCSMETLYLSLRAQVAVGTFFMKSAVVQHTDIIWKESKEKNNLIYE